MQSRVRCAVPVETTGMSTDASRQSGHRSRHSVHPRCLTPKANVSPPAVAHTPLDLSVAAALPAPSVMPAAPAAASFALLPSRSCGGRRAPECGPASMWHRLPRSPHSPPSAPAGLPPSLPALPGCIHVLSALHSLAPEPLENPAEIFASSLQSIGCRDALPWFVGK
jgi:hypothetical protein